MEYRNLKVFNDFHIAQDMLLEINCGYAMPIQKRRLHHCAYIDFHTRSIIMTEAASKGVLLKKLFLKILQNSQLNTCVRVSFIPS